MSDTKVSLEGVSLRFRSYQGYAGGLKEAMLRAIVPPKWVGTLPPTKKEFWALNDLTFDFRPGDRIAILGQNGAGKSTLLRVLSRIYKPTRGRVEVRGLLAPLIEIGAGFNPELTGRENAFLNAAILGIPGKVLSPRIPDIIDFSELGDFFDVPVKYYSTGMLLRLAFTVATEVTPDILILDELFAGADIAFIEKANRRLDEFIRKAPIFILVTHEMKYVERFCNRALLLDKGRLIADGPPAKVVETYMGRALGTSAPRPPSPPSLSV